MECYVLTLTEKAMFTSHSEYNVIGVYENKADIYSLMMTCYTNNELNLDEYSLNQYENSDGYWCMEIKGRKEKTEYTLKAEYQLEKITASIKELLNDLNITI